MDWRNLLPLSVYGLFFGSLYSMFYYFKLSLILSFGCFFLPLLPALNIVVPVGTVLAERLLFVPSMGFCLILGQLIVQYCEPLWNTLNTNIDSLIQKLLITSEIPLENDEDSLHNFTNAGIATPTKKPSKSNDVKYLNNKTPITKTPNLKRQLFASPKSNPLQSLLTSDSSKIYNFDSLFTFLTIIAVLCSYRVITRNIDWKSEYNIYSSALEVCPRSVKALSNYALLASNKYETNQALNASMKAIQIYPMHSAAWVNAGVAQLKLNQYSHAIYDFEKSVSISPRSIKSAAYMGQTLYSWAGIFSADSLYKQELLKMSIYWINMSIANGFCSPSILHIAGSAFYETRNYRSAIEFYNKAINMSTEARIARGGSTDVPIEDDIHIPFAYNQIGNLYSILLDYPSSIESYLQGLALDPKNVAILTNVAVVYRKMKNDNEARKHLLTAIELSGNSPPAALLNNLGSLELDNGNLLLAKEYYTRALHGIQTSKKYSVLPNTDKGQAQVEYRNDDSFGDVEKIISTNLLNVEKLLTNSKN
ncbi:hypothetical protein M1146_07255 [Patescibacteria group bacterium]|nr:hypothetical protein [Patescibacteria group bacterium]